MPIEVIVIILFLYAVGWLRQQAEKQKRKQALPPRPRPTRPRAGPTDGAERSSRPAREVLPDDLWREIEALARGEPPKIEVPEPPPVAMESKQQPYPLETQPLPRSVEPQSQPRPERESESWGEGRERAVRSRSPEVAGGAVVTGREEVPPEPRISVAGAPAVVFGSGLPVRLGSVTDAALTTRMGKDREGASATIQAAAQATPSDWLVGASPEDLRKAVILHAVLGPPLALGGREGPGQDGPRLDGLSANPEEPAGPG